MIAAVDVHYHDASHAAVGAAVVFATHDPEAAAACDRELHLSDGAAVCGCRPGQPWLIWMRVGSV